MSDPRMEMHGEAAAAAPCGEVTIRTSPRARRVRLVVSAGEGLVIVVPRGFDRNLVPDILAEHREWIARSRRKVQPHRATASCPAELPSTIELPAVGETWSVRYERDPSKGGGVRVGVSARQQRLVLRGRVDDAEACRAALLRWLTRRARAALAPRLETLAAERGLWFDKVSIRQQRSRWGSCSRRRTISLNARLLFFPPDLVDYVLVHELCHTVELNHSPRFWGVLEDNCPGTVIYRRRLRKVGQQLPTWLDGPLAGPPVAGAVPCEDL